jgi:hypothetical protein
MTETDNQRVGVCNRRCLKVQVTVRDLHLIVGPFMLHPPEGEYDPEGWLMNAQEPELLKAAESLVCKAVRQAVKQIDRYSQVSDDGQDFLVQLDPSMVDVNPNGCDIDVYDGPLDSLAEAIRRT